MDIVDIHKVHMLQKVIAVCWLHLNSIIFTHIWPGCVKINPVTFNYVRVTHMRPEHVWTIQNDTYFWWFGGGWWGRSCNGVGRSCRSRGVSWCYQVKITLRLGGYLGNWSWPLKRISFCGKLFFRGTDICHQISHQGVQVIVFQIMQRCFRGHNVKRKKKLSHQVAIF